MVSADADKISKAIPNKEVSQSNSTVNRKKRGKKSMKEGFAYMLEESAKQQKSMKSAETVNSICAHASVSHISSLRCSRLG